MSSLHDTCPACSAGFDRSRPSPLGLQLRDCGACGALYGTVYLGDSYAIVGPFLSRKPVPPERLRYFDFLCLGSEGITRRHGWFERGTGLLVQTG